MNVREKTNLILNLLFQENDGEVSFYVNENGKEQTGKIKLPLTVSLKPLLNSLDFEVKIHVAEENTVITY